MAKAVLIDLSGVVYQGTQLIPGAAGAIARLRESGLPLRFLTNTTRTPRRLIASQLRDMGVETGEAELFTPARSACDWLAARGLCAHLLVHEALEEDFPSFPGGGEEAVIVGDAGTGFTYDALNAAFRKLLDGAPFLALARNRTFMDQDGALSLDAGAFVAGLEYASRREAIVLGKPSPDFFATAVASCGCDRQETVMIGDDAEADIAGALSAGIGAALLVRTGKYRAGDELAFDPRPTALVDDLAAAIDRILE